MRAYVPPPGRSPCSQQRPASEKRPRGRPGAAPLRARGRTASPSGHVGNKRLPEAGRRSLDTLAPDGILIDVRGTGPDRAAAREQAHLHGLRFVQFGFNPSGADLESIADLVERGSLHLAVDQVLPLEAAAKAHELSETNRVQGKIVLTPQSCRKGRATRIDLTCHYVSRKLDAFL
ncbi:zinc-binding dehydrogenase [Streptomyces sp. NBC_01224]|nr:zinc-binding dehydrogenase [Streptomyces sp. NBC_01224]